MILRWHGHSCFEVENEVTVVTDPHDGRSLGLKKPKAKADIVLVSHDHFDHNAVQAIDGKPRVIREPGERTESGVKILGVESWHDDQKGAKRGRNIIFKFEMGGVRFCHLGDLGHVPDEKIARQLGKIDILMAPVGDVFTIDGKRALETARLLTPRVVVPMHFRFGTLTLGIKSLKDFTSLLKKDVIVKNVGNEIEFEREDFADEEEVWLFDL
ncbi:MAG: MBL fold metallo-hydrolase [Euryarchaeota archaeon]|nr:MBL fold metallo-hydrolase [Euryarchaeota archaeon]